MNKKLLTLAVAGAIVGGMGVAQADVTVYGKAHVSLDSMHVDKGTAGYANDGNLVVASNSSRLGFKFSEDLGGSFFKKAMGQYEATVSLDGEDAENTGGTSGTPAVTSVSTGLFGGPIRNSFLGVETAGGNLLAGIYDTPFKIVGRAVELFPEQLGDARNITSPGASNIGWDLRPTNSVAYMSPSMAGVTVMALWSADASTGVNTNTDNNNNTVASASVAYKGGPVYVAGAYEIHDSNYAGGTENETGYRIVASGTFGMFKVIGLYQGTSDTAGTAGADRDVWGLGAAVTLAEKHVIKAQYYSAGDIGATSDSGADMYAVGYDFKVSKKTTAYVNYAMTSNGANGSYGVNGGGHGDTLSTAGGAFRNADVSGVSAGMIMDF